MDNAKLLEHVYVVIMAGGRGERFWPVSTEHAPKPFLKLIDNKSLIQLTVERVGRILPMERIFVVLGMQHLEIAKKQLKKIPEQNFIIEPEGKDTAPCIGFSAITLLMRDKDAIMVTLPADQYVTDVDGFIKTIVNSVRFAKKGDYLITIGIKPSRPETGYGYIRAYEIFDSNRGINCYKVDRFVEKPDIKKAIQYIEEGNYYWNGGIFVWQVKTILKEIEKHMSELFEGLMRIKDIIETKKQKGIGEIYRSFTRKSIDYGVMEKADNVLMLKGDFLWDDIGTWQALARVFKTDAHGNYTHGDTVCIDTEGSVVYGDGIKVGTIGVSNLVIVASKKGVLVCERERSQEVREIARQIEVKKAKR